MTRPFSIRAALRNLAGDRGLRLAAASGVFAAASFFPLPWGLGAVLMLGALVPLLEAARGAGWRRGAWYGAVMGLTAVAGAFHWLLPLIARFSGLPLPIAFLGFAAAAAWGAVFWALLGALWGSRRAGPLLVVFMPVALECVWPRVFRWHFGDPLAEIPVLAQISDLAGMSGRSLLVLTVNYALWRVTLWCRRRIPFPRAAAATALAFLAATAAYGAYCFTLPAALAPRLDVALVHAAIALEDKHAALADASYVRDGAGVKVWRGPRYRALERELIGRGKGAAADLVVFPEAVLWLDRGEQSSRLAPEIGAAVLVGCDVSELVPGDPRPRIYNGAVLETGSGRQFYFKHRLMPFGEEVPFGRWVPAIARLGRAAGIGMLDAGDGARVMTLDGHRLAPLICYEATVPEYVAEFVKQGAEILVNITEDGWYGWTGEPYQHLLLARSRAIENRRTLLRCVNNGVTAIVDPWGRLTAVDADPARPGIVRGSVELRSDLTPFTRWHAWQRGAFVAAAAALALWRLRPRRD
ncbi:MAG TPA: apolipoprotein N-acyltransferase [Planctomycetota bacterium]|nr:apolipoprotein N-acyltransferase [Planctomycetota bacterium]